jgi:hypothetical protein
VPWIVIPRPARYSVGGDTFSLSQIDARIQPPAHCQLPSITPGAVLRYCLSDMRNELLVGGAT